MKSSGGRRIVANVKNGGEKGAGIQERILTRVRTVDRSKLRLQKRSFNGFLKGRRAGEGSDGAREEKRAKRRE